MWAVLMVLAAAPAFEGVLVYQLSARNAEGTVKTSVSKLGVRSEASLKFGASRSDTIVLVKAAAPQTSLVWNAEKREFVAQAPQVPQRKVTRVEPLGEGSVLGLACKKVRLHDDQQGFTEYCVAKDALGDAAVDRLVATAQRLDAEALAGLASAGVKGLVVKMVHVAKGEQDLWLELSALERRAVDPALMK